MTIVYRVRDKNSGAYWNGNLSWSRFDSTGKNWKGRASCEDQVLRVLRYQKQFRSSNLSSSVTNWEIVELELKVEEKKSHNLGDIIEFGLIKEKLIEHHSWYGTFYSMMRKRGVDKDIQFILTPGKLTTLTRWRMLQSQTLEARASLRQLGIKTRTYREYQGMFGMMDRDQAMKAKLALPSCDLIDVYSIREQVRKDLSLS